MTFHFSLPTSHRELVPTSTTSNGSGFSRFLCARIICGLSVIARAAACCHHHHERPFACARVAAAAGGQWVAGDSGSCARASSTAIRLRRRVGSAISASKPASPPLSACLRRASVCACLRRSIWRVCRVCRRHAGEPPLSSRPTVCIYHLPCVPFLPLYVPFSRFYISAEVFECRAIVEKCDAPVY